MYLRLGSKLERRAGWSSDIVFIDDDDIHGAGDQNLEHSLGELDSVNGTESSPF